MMRILKIAALLLCITICVCSFSGCSSAKNEFKSQADEFFTEFSELKSFGEAIGDVVYSKNAPYAINYLKTGNDAADKLIADYIDLKKNNFLEKSERKENSGNKLFVDYSCYKASDSLVGVVLKVVEKNSEDAVLSEEYKTFNLDLSKGADITEELLTTKLRNKMSRYLNRYSNEKLGGEMSFNLNSEEISGAVLSENGILVHINNYESKVQIPYADVARQIDAGLRDNLSITAGSGTIIRDIDPDKPMVALTFDDGPSSKYTDKILDILEDYDSVATFFEVASNLKNDPDAVRRAAEMGCEIGSHTNIHANLSKLDAAGIREELNKANAEFIEVLGYEPELLRPPYGACNSLVKETCDQYLIGWSVDTLDWKNRDSDAVLNAVKSEDSLNGDVILMHSLYGSTVEAVEQMVPWLISEGYQLVTVSELIEYGYNSELTLGKYYEYTFFDGIE